MAQSLQTYFDDVKIYVPTGTTILPATVYAQINKARRFFAAITDATLTTISFTLTANVADYPFANHQVTTRDILTVYDPVWYYIGNLRVPIKRKLAIEYPYSNFNSSMFDRYWIKNRILTYWPTPAMAVVTDWKVSLQPKDLSTLADPEEDFTLEYWDVITLLAAKFVALADSNMGLAKEMDSLYANMLDKLPRNRL